jgi:predicted Zn-dependent protease with MMP-like domain
MFGIRGRVVDLVAKLAEEPAQLVEAAVYVADDVERPVVVAGIAPEALALLVSAPRYRQDNGLVIEVDPWRFEEMVAAALDGLPEDLGRLMSNVAVTVEHGAGPPGLLGLYEGIPLTSRTTGYAGVLPDRITIYRQAICAICQTEQEVADQVRRTVIHEVAHHFGIGDKRLAELGW